MSAKNLFVKIISMLKSFAGHFRSICWLIKYHLKNECFVWEGHKGIDSTHRKVLSDLRKSGIAQVNNFFTTDECDALKIIIDNELSSQRSYVWIDEVGSDHRLYGAEQFNSQFNDFFENRFINRIHQIFERAENTNGFTLASKISYKPGNLGSGGGWHRDRVFLKQFKALLYLTDTDEGNGCFEYLLESHKISQIIKTHLKGVSMHNNRFGDVEMEKLSLDYKKFQAVGKKGTLILVDTRGIHRGRPLEKGVRYALTRYFFKEGVPASIYENYPHLKRNIR